MAKHNTNTTPEEPDTTTQASTENADQSALDGLAAQVDADTQGAAPDGSIIADQPAPIDYATEAAATVDTFAALVGGYCAEAGALWTPDTRAAVAAALAPVMQKYGFTIGALPCELVLIITAGPLLYQTSKIIAAQMAREKATAKKPTDPAQVQDVKPKATGPETPEVKRHPQEALYQ